MKLRKLASKIFDHPSKCILGKKTVIFSLNMYSSSHFHVLKIMTNYLTSDPKNAKKALCL